MDNNEEPSRKRKNKAKYIDASKRSRTAIRHSNRVLQPGSRGFLITCLDGRTGMVIHDAYSLLNHYVDTQKIEAAAALDAEKATVQCADDSSSSADDIEACLAAEAAVLRSIKPVHEPGSATTKAFQALETGVRNIVFVRCDLPTLSVTDCVSRILEDAAAKAQADSRFMQRILPVQATCKALDSYDDLQNVMEPLIAEHFGALPHSFCIQFKARCNDRWQRDEVIDILGRMIHQVNHHCQANLTKPDRTLLVEVVGNVACVAIVNDYVQLRKYNIQEVATAAKKVAENV